MTTPSSDEKLRDLERRFRQTGSPDDEAAWLQERVRVGDLAQERLELAAHCGHEGARRAVDRRPADVGPDEIDLWIRALPMNSDRRRVLAVVAFHAAWSVRHFWPAQFPEDDAPLRCLDSVARWIRKDGTGDVEVRDTLCAATDAWREDMFQLVPSGGSVSDERWAAWRVAEAAAHAASVVVIKDRREENRVETQALEAVTEVLSARQRLGEDAGRASRELLASLRAHTARWALYADLLP